MPTHDRSASPVDLSPLTPGQVAFLPVTHVNGAGVFIDVGLEEGVFVPQAELIREVEIGQRHPFALVRDAQRLLGTMRIAERLRPKSEFVADQWVRGEAWRNDPDIGLFVVVERFYLGMVPAEEPHRLTRGQAAWFRIASVLPDGKLELSLRGPVHEELEHDADAVLALLRSPGAPRLGDRSPPDFIRHHLVLSKKAFRRALGRLLKRGDIVIDDEGFAVVRRR